MQVSLYPKSEQNDFSQGRWKELGTCRYECDCNYAVLGQGTKTAGQGFHARE